jgi:hypothetical protein
MNKIKKALKGIDFAEKYMSTKMACVPRPCDTTFPQGKGVSIVDTFPAESVRRYGSAFEGAKACEWVETSIYEIKADGQAVATISSVESWSETGPGMGQYTQHHVQKHSYSTDAVLCVQIEVHKSAQNLCEDKFAQVLVLRNNEEEADTRLEKWINNNVEVLA